MDLTLIEVADLLNVSQATIRRWIADGRIPYYKLQQQIRFSRSEIENWVLSSKQGGEFAPFMEEGSEERLGTHQFSLYRALHKGGVYSGIQGTTKEEFIRGTMKLLARDLRLDEEVLTELLLDREKLMSTGLANGVAVPHTRDFLLQESFDVVTVVFPEQPIEYDSLDGLPVHTLFFLFACDDKRHLNLLAKIAHLSSKEENLAFLRSRPTKGEFLDYIKKWEGELKIGLRGAAVRS